MDAFQSALKLNCTFTLNFSSTYSGRQNWRKSPFLNNFFEIMKKRHNSAPWAPDEASPYLNESSRCAESESEKHFVRKAHCSMHLSVKTFDFPIKRQSQNRIEIKFQRNIWGQLDVRTRMRASKSRNFDLEKLKLSFWRGCGAVSYTHLRAHETDS